MYHMRGQTRVSMVPEKNTFRLEGAGMLSFGFKVTKKGLRLMNGDEYAVCLSLTRVTKSYLLALGTTQITSFFTKHLTKFLTHQTVSRHRNAT